MILLYFRRAFFAGLFLSLTISTKALAQASVNPLAGTTEVEWYPPETERSKIPGYAVLIIAGKTTPGAQVQVDGASVTNLTSPGKGAVKGQQTLANDLGYFEMKIDFPQGLIQIPIAVQSTDKKSKTFLINFNVSLTNVKMNTQATTKKPPAAAKSVRLWFGLGTTYQTYGQNVTGLTDVTLQNSASPSLLGRAGYWGDRWGFDFFFRDAPGKIDSATQPFKINSGNYHWQTVEGRGHYQFLRGNRSRFLGMPTQWLLLFGTQFHKMPFLDIDATNSVTVRQHQLVMATLGAGVLLAQERDWSYEAAIEYQMPLSSSAGGGNSFKVSSPFAVDARFGVTSKFARNWRTGIFAYLQSHKYAFQYQNTTTGMSTSGEQRLFYSTVDVHVGYEY